MKKKTILILFVSFLFFVVSNLFAQAPEAFKYQTTVRDSLGNLITGKTVYFRISILKGSMSGSVSYMEEQQTQTNQFGQVNINVGTGTNKQDSISGIDWKTGKYFIKIEYKQSTGDTYQVMGISQLLSVPYALYADRAGTLGLTGTTGQTIYNNGTTWEANSNLYNDGTNVGIGTSYPQAKLDVSSTALGMLIPRLSTIERNAITTPAESMILFNSTTKCFEAYVNDSWYSVSCPPPCNHPAVPTAGTNASSATQIVWNWSNVSGATGYKWGTTNDYSSAIDNGVSSTYTQTGLTCSTSYTLYVWAYNSCGNSNVTILTQTTSPCFNCGSSLTITHTAGSVAPVTETVTYHTVLASLTGTSECWLTQNLGATQQASSATDNSDASAGWYWEWDTQQGYDYNTTLTPSTWQSVNGPDGSWIITNDPCSLLLSGGWRIPTYTEWNNANANGGWMSYTNTYNSVLKLHSAGYLDPTNGTLNERGSSGHYWSSKLYDTMDGWNLSFYSNYCNIISNPLTYGFSLRCLNP
jgi:uncharacterized protein (TIGR02145 family)